MRFRLGRPTPLPPEIDKPEVLAFIAAMLAWREGDEAPRPPAQLTMSVSALMVKLNDPAIRRGVAERLGPLMRRPSRAERRARR